MDTFVVINRDQHSRDFTIISNRILRDGSISYHSRYLMTWLLSYNPKPGFKYSLELIARKINMPLSRVRSSVQELQDAGYIKLERTRNGARYGHYRWIINEIPTDEVKEETVQEHDAPAAAEIITTEQFNFEQFWNKYPKKVNHDNALKEFLKIPDVNTIFPDIMRALDIQIKSKQWREEGGRYIPSPENYLKKSSWNGVVDTACSEDEAFQNLEERLNEAQYRNI